MSELVFNIVVLTSMFSGFMLFVLASDFVLGFVTEVLEVDVEGLLDKLFRW